MSMNRRSFITFAAGGVAGTLATPVIWKTLDDLSIWSQNWGWIPRLQYGAVERKPAISKLYPSGTPVQVVTVDGRPVTLAGSTANPISAGGLSAICAAEVQMLYSPARIKTPLKKVAAGKYEAMSWADAEGLLASRIKAARGSVAMVSGDENGTANEVFGAFLKGVGSEDFYLMPGEQQTAAKAWKAMGQSGLPGYDTSNSDCVLALGAELLDSFGPALANAKAFGEARKAGEEPTVKYLYAGPVRKRTGVVCDKWVAVKPGCEAAFALGVAWHLIEAGASTNAKGFAELKTFVKENCSPKQIEASCGIKAEGVKTVASALAKAKHPVVVAGSAAGQGGDPAVFAAGVMLNALLGNVNQPGGMRIVADLPTVVAGAKPLSELAAVDFVDYLLAVKAGQKKAPKVLLAYEANPRYALAQAGEMSKVIDAAEFVVSFSSFMDETAAAADLILPTPMGFERFEDMGTPYGAAYMSYSACEPVTTPVFDQKPATDVLLSLAAGMNLNLGFASFDEVVAAKAKTVGSVPGFISDSKNPAESIAKFEAGETGDILDALFAGNGWFSTHVASEMTELPVKALSAVKPAKASSEYPLVLAPMYQVNVGTPKFATPAFNLLTIMEDELQGTNMAVFLCSETAKTYGLSNGQKVAVSTAAGKVGAFVTVDETVAPGVVAAALGFGHTAWDAATKGKGGNVYSLLTVAEQSNGMPGWTGTKVKVAKS